MARTGEREIDDDIGRGQVRLCASQENVARLLEVEQIKDALHLEKIELETWAKKVISDFYKNGFYVWAFTVGMSIHLTTNIQSVNGAFVSYILLVCIILTGTYFQTYWAKMRITRINRYVQFLTERHKKVRADARILMELEKIRKKKLATNVIDNGEGPVVSMDSFITRTKTMYDTTYFPNFKTAYHKKINLSWVFGGVHVIVLLVLAYFMYLHEFKQGQDCSSTYKLRMPYEEARSTWRKCCFFFKNL